MADERRPNRQRRQPQGRPGQRPPQRQAPGPLLAAMASLIAILFIASFLTEEWGFMFLGVFGLAAGLVPFVSRR